jgi:hypothetical protein
MVNQFLWFENSAKREGRLIQGDAGNGCDFGTEPDTVFHHTCVGNGAFEATASVHIVFQELAMYKRTFDEPAAGKRCPSETTVLKSALDEVTDVEETRIPIDFFERAIAKVGGDHVSVRRQTLKVAVLEVVVGPLYR